nr:MAG TPA: hypothetical protein [Siphoviridae sp. ctS248]
MVTPSSAAMATGSESHSHAASSTRPSSSS